MDFKRIITSIALIVLTILVAQNVTVLIVYIAILAAIAVFEVLSAANFTKTNPVLVGLSVTYAFLLPFAKFYSGLSEQWILYVFLFILFCAMFISYPNMKIESIAFCFLFSYFIPATFVTIVNIRNFPAGAFFIFLVFMLPWFTDAFAYIFGKAFGKKKIFPEISPNKTVVGAVFGIVGGITSVLIFAGILQSFTDYVILKYIPLIVAGALCALVSELGDLIASILKRHFGVKDFGSLFPGHGGVMDRFDSVIFVSPILYTFIEHFSVIL